MANQKSKPVRTLDVISAIVFIAAILAALTFYFLFYTPGIDQGINSYEWMAKSALLLKVHIAVYGISYALFFVGLLWAVILCIKKATTNYPWLGTAFVLATILAVVGLITGVLFSKPAWNAWWVWDAKHTFVLINTIFLLSISPSVVLARSYSNPVHRNLAFSIIFFCASSSCVGSLLIGFTRNFHPQWFLNLFFRFFTTNIWGIPFGISALWGWRLC